MDQMSQLFQSSTGDGGWLSKFLTSPGLKLGLAGSGAAGNIMANRAKNQVLSKEMQQMDALTKLTPAQITGGITSLQQPLSANLINNVTNATQAKMAERGLSQAPGIFGTELAQGLAPYQIQEQQLAQDAFFKKLGLPISARPSPFGPFPDKTNTSQLWQSLIQQFQGLGNKVNDYNRPGSVSGGIPGMDSSLFPTNWGLEGIIPTGTPNDWSGLGVSIPDFSSTQPGGG